MFHEKLSIDESMVPYSIPEIENLKYRVIQKSGRTLKMNNSETNKDKKMRFAPNGLKRSRVLYGNEKKINSVGDQQMAL
jgi:hypothetical protein